MCFFFKQKTAYEMRISDWSSDVCSSDLPVMKKMLILLSLLSSTLLAGCGYNTLQSQDEQIKASWAEVLNQYQRRADLVPNLVNTVKGYAQHEEKVLTEEIGRAHV